MAAADIGGRRPAGVASLLLLRRRGLVFVSALAMPPRSPFRWAWVCLMTRKRAIQSPSALLRTLAGHPALKSSPRNRVPLVDRLLAAAGIAAVLYLIVCYHDPAMWPGLPTRAAISAWRAPVADCRAGPRQRALRQRSGQVWPQRGRPGAIRPGSRRSRQPLLVHHSRRGLARHHRAAAAAAAVGASPRGRRAEDLMPAAAAGQARAREPSQATAWHQYGGRRSGQLARPPSWRR